MKTWKIMCLTGLLVAGCQHGKTNNETETEEPDTVMVTAAEGNEAPDFTLPGPDGMPLTLSDLRGRYVVLDFWGTWCKWCVKGIPEMKTYYNRYRDKLDMVSIDFGDDEETWRSAIEDYEMDWLHVTTDDESAASLQAAYGIEGFPTKIVIDPAGSIIHVTVGEEPSFYEYLDELFAPKK